MLMIEPQVKQEEWVSPAGPIERVFIDLTISDDDGENYAPEPLMGEQSESEEEELSSEESCGDEESVSDKGDCSYLHQDMLIIVNQ